ncbi:MAG TPA: SAM-dependent methyltransferase [Terriglobales bacterium]|nr:SAM-dependent methyltransferase [Terriglobales bacterium]
MSLRSIIEQDIRAHGPIPFSRYMELCLYHPELGYYSRRAEQFGKAGDFYTSSDVHAVFGRLLARQFEEIWRALDSPAEIEILELGPGRGLFAQDVLAWSEKKFPEFFRALHYSLAEQSPKLRDRLRGVLAGFLESGKASSVSENAVEKRDHRRLMPWFSDASGGAAEAAISRNAAGSFYADTAKAATATVPGNPLEQRELAAEVPVIVFANELFDALPVEILSPQGALRVSVENGRFVETWVPPCPEELDFLDRYGVHPEAGEHIEVPLLAHRYMAGLAASLRAGMIIAVDYGYTRQEQLSGRHRGTLMAYRQHSALLNPYDAPGEQDLTAHVNFTALSAAAEENGMQAQPLVTQSQFLMGIGEANQFADAFEDCVLPQERAKVALQLKHLVTPAGMGETFHVLVASKGLAPARVEGLSGLSFAKSRL